MTDPRTANPDRVPRTVWIAIAVVLLCSLAPVYASVMQWPDLLRGDIHGRRLVAGDWASAVQPLILAAAFWAVAVLIYRRSRRGRLAFIVLGGVIASVSAIILAVDFDAAFLLGALVFAVPMLVAPHLPGVAEWCSD